MEFFRSIKILITNNADAFKLTDEIMKTYGITEVVSLNSLTQATETTASTNTSTNTTDISTVRSDTSTVTNSETVTRTIKSDPDSGSELGSVEEPVSSVLTNLNMILGCSKLFVWTGSIRQILQGLEKSRILILIDTDYVHQENVNLPFITCQSLAIHGIIREFYKPKIILSSPLVIDTMIFDMQNIQIYLDPVCNPNIFHFSTLYTTGGLILSGEIRSVTFNNCSLYGVQNKHINLVSIPKSAKNLEVKNCFCQDVDLYFDKCQTTMIERNQFTNTYIFMRFANGSMYMNVFYGKVRLDLFNCTSFIISHNAFIDVHSPYKIFDIDHNSIVFFTSNRVKAGTPSTDNILTVYRYSRCIISECSFQIPHNQLFGTVSFGSSVDLGLCSFNQPVIEVASDSGDIHAIYYGSKTSDNTDDIGTLLYVTDDGVSKPAEIQITQRGLILPDKVCASFT